MADGRCDSFHLNVLSDTHGSGWASGIEEFYDAVAIKMAQQQKAHSRRYTHLSSSSTRQLLFAGNGRSYRIVVLRLTMTSFQIE